MWSTGFYSSINKITLRHQCSLVSLFFQIGNSSLASHHMGHTPGNCWDVFFKTAQKMSKSAIVIIALFICLIKTKIWLHLCWTRIFYLKKSTCPVFSQIAAFFSKRRTQDVICSWHEVEEKHVYGLCSITENQVNIRLIRKKSMYII